jgi:hypothetical protein
VNAAFLVAIVLLLVAGYATGQAVTPGSSVTGNGTTTNETGIVVTNSDQSLTGSFITPQSSTWPGATPSYPNDKVWNICTAVALAEGFNIGPGAAPYDLNNPGDLSPGDEAGQATNGQPQVHDGSSIIVFSTCEGGFIALYTKFNNMVTGQSKVYPVTWTWAQVAKKYAGNSAVWLANVTSYLGVDPSSTPAQYVASA